MTTLEDAIKQEIGPDPYHGEPHSETVAAFADLIRAMARVSNKRPKEYADEPWRGMLYVVHLEHAFSHVDCALAHSNSGYPQLCLDDDGEPHLAHAAVRIAFALGRAGK
jgi:hypothetical protein